MVMSSSSTKTGVVCCVILTAALGYTSALQTTFSCSFENNNTCGMAQDTTDDFDWTIMSGSTTSVLTGPTVDKTTQTISGRYIYIEASSPRIVNDKARLISPSFYSGKYVIQFHYFPYGDDLGGMNVYISSLNSTFHQLVWYWSRRLNSTASDWRNVHIEATSYENFTVVFEGWRNEGSAGDFAMDDIAIYRVAVAPVKPVVAPYGLPFNCDFESGTCGLLSPHYLGQMNWARALRGFTSTANTGPSSDRYGENGYYLQMDATDGQFEHQAVIATPNFWPICGCFNLQFYYHAYGIDINKLQVYLAGVFSPIVDLDLTSENIWKFYNETFDIEAPTSLVIVGVRGATSNSDIALDEIYVSECDCSDSTTESLTLAIDDLVTTTTPTTTLTTTLTMLPTTSSTSVSTGTQTSTSQITISKSETINATTSGATGGRLSSPSPTTTPLFTSTTLDPNQPYGQHTCTFFLDTCEYEMATNGFHWTRVNTLTNSMPESGSAGWFLYADGRIQAGNQVARVETQTAFNPEGCNGLTFNYHLFGNSSDQEDILSIVMLRMDDSILQTLWLNNESADQWRDGAIYFRHTHIFKLRFEAVRVSPISQFAIDTIRLKIEPCVIVPLYPPNSPNSQATASADGLTTSITGTMGAIYSLNYPADYTNNHEHTWLITVSSGSTVQISVVQFQTELNADILTAYDGSSTQAGVLFSLSGSQINLDYQTSTNTATLHFLTDEAYTQPGFLIRWAELLPTTTPASYGEFLCKFDTATDCPVETIADDVFGWRWVTGASPNYPNSGPSNGASSTGPDGYIVAVTNVTLDGDVAAYTSQELFSNNGIFEMSLSYYAYGANLGSLTASVVTSASRKKRDTRTLWQSDDQSIDQWRTITRQFEQHGPFVVKITAKRILNGGLFGGGDYALDKFSVYPIEAFSTTPTPSLLNGGLTSQSGVSGVIRSPNYPSPYPTTDPYTHTWRIESDHTNKSITLSLLYFSTELCCDVLTVYDGATSEVIAVLSGDIQPTALAPVSTSSNLMTLVFTADDEIAFNGFELTWVEVDRPTTAPPSAANTARQVNTTPVKDDTFKYMIALIVVGCALILSIIIAIIVLYAIRKKNAQKNKISGSQELLTARDENEMQAFEDREPKLVEQGNDFEPKSLYGQYRLPPIGHSTTSQSYDQTSLGDASAITGYTTMSTLGDYPPYTPRSLHEHEPNDVMTNSLKKKHRSSAGQDASYDDSVRRSSKSKKSKKLKPIRASDQFDYGNSDLLDSRRSYYGLSLKLEPPQESAEIQAENDEIQAANQEIQANTVANTISTNNSHSIELTTKTDVPYGSSNNAPVPRLELNENSL